jgi:acyl-CoA thioester hydrolase
MGVVHHASYVPWLEIARTEMLRAGGVTYRQMEEAGVFLVVASMDLKYRRPGRYDDLVEIDCQVSGGSRVKLIHRYSVRVVERAGADVARLGEAGDDVLVEASTTLVCVGADMAVRALPDWLTPAQA